jgi:hypothetical protein
MGTTLYKECFMAIEYVMKPNHLDTTKESYRAQVVNSESFGAADVVDYVSRTNAGVSKPEIVSIEAAFEDAFAYFLSQGKSFHSPLLRLSLSIRGSYEKGEHPSSKNIHANAYVGPLLQQAAESASVKTGQEAIRWAIEQVVDVSSGIVDNAITTGKAIRIEGKGLTLVGDDAAVEFLNDAGGAPVKVRAAKLAVNTPSLLVLDVPQVMTMGLYHVCVVTRYTGGAPADSPHTITHDVSLAIQSVFPETEAQVTG